MFATTHTKVSQCRNQTEKTPVPLPDETLADICKVLKFLYQRLLMPYTSSPSKQLCSSYDDIHPIVRLAHKWNMQVILDECDKSLTSAVKDNSSFADSLKDAAVAVKWAALAEKFDLSEFLAHVELALVRNDVTFSWLSKDLALETLSKKCICRLLQGLQCAVFTAEDTLAVTQHSYHYHGPRPGARRIAADLEVSAPVLQKWRQQQES